MATMTLTCPLCAYRREDDFISPVLFGDIAGEWCDFHLRYYLREAIAWNQTQYIVDFILDGGCREDIARYKTFLNQLQDEHRRRYLRRV